MQHHEPTAKERFMTGLANFLVKNRIILLGALAALVVAIAAYAIYDYTTGRADLAAIALTEEAQSIYSEYVSADEEAQPALREEFLATLDEVLASGGKSFAKQRAYFLLGILAVEEEDWPTAAENFLRVFEDYPRSYLAPVAGFNASGAYEETGDLASATDVLTRLFDIYGSSSPVASRALFNLARIQDTSGSTAEALLTYNRLVDLFPDSNWTKLARTRIISLNTR